MRNRKTDGLRLKVLRVEAGVKAVDVAAVLRWNPSKLSLIENGRVKADRKEVERIEKAIKELRGKA